MCRLSRQDNHSIAPLWGVGQAGWLGWVCDNQGCTVGWQDCDSVANTWQL